MSDQVASRLDAGTPRRLVIGSRWKDGLGEVRVMAIVEGYVVVRRKGCVPFCEHSSNFGTGKMFDAV